MLSRTQLIKVFWFFFSKKNSYFLLFLTAADFTWHQHPGASLNLPRTGLPTILDPGYFHCPSLCGVVRGDVYAALEASGLRLGKDVSLLAVSIDPAETADDAARALREDLGRFPHADPAGVRYLTASAPAIAAMEDGIGLHAQWDAGLKQFLHPAGIVVLTGTGQVSAYLLGVGYTGGDLRAAVLRAGDGGIARAALPILLLCFHFDSTTGRYTLAVEKLLRLLAALTIAGVLGLVATLALRRQGDRG